jgi:hypothetical protein
VTFEVAGLLGVLAGGEVAAAQAMTGRYHR